MLYFYIYPKMLLPRVQILKSDVVFQLADIENIFLFYRVFYDLNIHNTWNFFWMYSIRFLLISWCKDGAMNVFDACIKRVYLSLVSLQWVSKIPKSNYIIYWLTTFSLCIHQEFQYWMFIPPPHSIQLLSRMMVRGKTRKISRLLAKVMLAQIISCRLGTSQGSLWVLDLDFRLFSSFFYIGRMYY